jgi:hypothetical protein
MKKIEIMTRLNSFVFIFLCAVCFCGCNPSHAPESQADENQQGQQPLAVKGLYIGLDYNSLASVVAKKFDSGQWQIERDNYPYCYVRSLDLEKVRNSYMQVSLNSVPKDLQTEASIKVDVTFDPAGKLGYIFIPHRCGAFLFNSSSMTAAEFCQNFVNAYAIPTMNRDVATDGTGFWKCTTPDNVTVKITDEKDVYFFKDTSQQDVQKKFN